ncbi:hypothetical protein GCM10023081_28190 [Arthrobacter ginkgonis]|uniref:Uncharacterized protein n=1 Tax=Arthrobacter ginkgonis TaxID=1630594 RepID=A0ABP7CI45_9MICC
MPLPLPHIPDRGPHLSRSGDPATLGIPAPLGFSAPPVPRLAPAAPEHPRRMRAGPLPRPGIFRLASGPIQAADIRRPLSRKPI